VAALATNDGELTRGGLGFRQGGALAGAIGKVLVGGSEKEARAAQQ
jgi:hypothetical protein